MAVGTSLLFMLLLGAVAACILIFAARVFHVAVDERVEAVVEVLPGINCGACGYSSCYAAAEAVVVGKSAGPDVCLIGGPETTQKIEKLLNCSSEKGKRKIAFIRCSKNSEAAGRRYQYNGPSDCFSATLLFGGEKQCEEGCIGLGSCVLVCPVTAITMRSGLPVVDTIRCIGCGLCVSECPKKIIVLVEDEQKMLDKKRCDEYCMRSDNQFVVDQEKCIKCGLCSKRCPVGAIEWEKGSAAVIDRDKCIECYTCMRVCPAKVIF